MKHVIIGVGAAGITAAKTIRSYRSDDEIVMISLDNFVHSRCMLHKYLAHERNEETLSFVSGTFFADNQIKWIKDTPVEGIDTDRKAVILPGQEVSYDKLLIATGANSVIPPIGALKTAGNVYGLRHLTDAQAIDQKLNSSQKIVIIGSGLVGLDAAYAFLERGKAVTIVEMAESILPLQLDANAASAYQKRFEEDGCVFKLGKKAAKTICNADGDITHLVLDDGEELPCDMIMVAAGVRPAVQFLEGSKIACERAVKVDHTLQTNCPDVYAAGDAAGLSGIWPNAMKQGEIAAKNMCGLNAEYTDTFAIKNTINFYSLVTLSVGQIMAGPEDEVFIREDRGSYHKIVMRDGRVVGVILQGNISNSGIWQYLIKNKIDVSKINKPVWKVSYADFFSVKENGEYQWAI